MRNLKLLSAAAASTFIFSGSHVDAAAFQLKGTTTAVNGHAYSGTASKPGEISLQFNNPALMTTIDSHGADASLSLIIPDSKFRPDARSSQETGGLGGNGGETNLVPAIYAVGVLSPDWRVGLGISIPYGNSTKWDSNWVGRFNSIESDLLTINVNPAVAYRANKWFSIGGGLSFQYVDIELRRAAAVPNRANLGNPADLLERQIVSSGHDLAAGFNLGVLFDLQQGTTIGLAYRSQINHGLNGFVKAQGAEARVFAEFTTPDTVDLSVSHQFNEAWSAHATVFFTRWNLFNNLNIISQDNVAAANSPIGQNLTRGSTVGGESAIQIQNYKNAFFFALGGEYKPNKDWDIQFGLAHDQTPIRDENRTAQLPGADRYWVSLGVNYHFGEQMRAGISYSYIYVDDGKINQPYRDVTNTLQNAVAPNGVAPKRLSGKFDNHVDLIGLHFVYKF